MSYQLDIRFKTGDGFIAELQKIPDKTSKLDCSLTDIFTKSTDELEAFSTIPDSVTHINLSYNVTDNNRIKKISCLFSAISKTNITSINLYGTGFENLNNDSIHKLNNGLAKIKTIYLKSDQIAEIVKNNRYDLIGKIIKNVQEVIVLDNDYREIVFENSDHAFRRYYIARKFNPKAELPSLKDITAYFVQKNKITKTALPEELKEHCENIGANLYKDIKHDQESSYEAPISNNSFNTKINIQSFTNLYPDDSSDSDSDSEPEIDFDRIREIISQAKLEPDDHSIPFRRDLSAFYY